jgi:S-adenosylmethionine:tRNA ribosyltransferase-isomerase
VSGNPDHGPAPLATADFDYELPPRLIAHHPAERRDASRLMLVRRDADAVQHRRFTDIVELIPAGDVLVLNETRVFPARLLGTRPGGGQAEIVLLRPMPAADGGASFSWESPDWSALARPGSRLMPGRRVRVGAELEVEIVAVLEDGLRQVRLHTPLPVREAVHRYGRIPLPPYIERDPEEADRERYQTVYGSTEGSVAAPTAGLHFTPALLEALRQKGVEVVSILLHVGVGTFRPVEAEDPSEHVMHAEWFEVGERQAETMNRVRQRGGHLWAVGTTVVRTLESVVERDVATPPESGAPPVPRIRPGSGWTDLYIRPGFPFGAVDRLITNFHLPRSTLLMLVSALAGHRRTMAAYREAVGEGYRFYSYGDAMVIL